MPKQAWAEEGYQGRLAYIKCMMDAALPRFVQDRFIEGSQVQWKVETMEASHSPFASKPKETADLAIKLLDGFRGS